MESERRDLKSLVASRCPRQGARMGAVMRGPEQRVAHVLPRPPTPPLPTPRRAGTTAGKRLLLKEGTRCGVFPTDLWPEVFLTLYHAAWLFMTFLPQ